MPPIPNPDSRSPRKYRGLEGNLEAVGLIDRRIQIRVAVEADQRTDFGLFVERVADHEPLRSLA